MGKKYEECKRRLLHSKQQFGVVKMEVSQQQAFSVATTEGEGRLKRDYMLRVRLSPAERYELNYAAEKLALNESATIRWLISHYPDIKKAADDTALATDIRCKIGLFLAGGEK